MYQDFSCLVGRDILYQVHEDEVDYGLVSGFMIES